MVSGSRRLLHLDDARDGPDEATGLAQVGTPLVGGTNRNVAGPACVPAATRPVAEADELGLPGPSASATFVVV